MSRRLVGLLLSAAVATASTLVAAPVAQAAPAAVDLVLDAPSSTPTGTVTIAVTAESGGAPAAGAVTVQVLDADGSQVTATTLTPTPAPSVGVSWTGTLARGTYTISASFVPTDPLVHAPATETQALTVTAVDAITAPSAPTRAVIGARWTAPTATSTSGRTATVAAGPTGVCAMAGADVTYDGVGTCTVTFSTTTSGTWVGASETVSFAVRTDATLTLTFDPATPLHQKDFTITATLTDTATGARVPYAGPGSVTVSGQPSVPVTFANGVATTGNLRLARGTYTVSASVPAQGDYHAEDLTGVPLSVAKGIQVVTAPTAPTGAVVGGRWLAPTATVTPSGGTVVVTAGPVGVCSVSSADVVYDGVGDCTVTFTAPATANLDGASASVTVPVTRRVVTLALDVPTPSEYGRDVVVTATVTDTTATSPGTSPDATVPGTFTLTVDGTDVPVSVDAATGTATYTFSPPTSGSYTFAASFVPTATGRHTTPADRSSTLVVTVADQTVAAANAPAQGYKQDVWQMTLSRGGSGNPVVLTSLTPATCVLTAATGGTVSLPPATTSTEVQFVDAGTCRIGATQAGVADKYLAADDVIEVAVVKVPVVVTLTVSADPVVGELVVVKAAARAGGRVGSALYGKAVAGGGPVGISPDGPVVDRAWFGGGELLSFRPPRAISYTASATFAPVDTALYATPAVVTTSFTVGKAVQTITLGNPAPAPAYVTQVWDPQASGGGSGNPVLMSVADDTVCGVEEIGDPTTSPPVLGIRFRAPGSCAVTFTQAGDDDHLPAATGDPVLITVAKIPVTLTITSSVAPRVGTTTTFYASARSALDGSPVAGTATFRVEGPTDRGDVAPAVLPSTVTWNGSSGRATATAVHRGAHDVTVSFTPDAAFPDVAAATRTESVMIDKGSQAITFTTPPPAQVGVDGTWSSGARTNATGLAVTGLVVPTDAGPVEIGAPPQVCTVTGTSVTFDRAGLCRIVWSQAGDGDWQPAADVTTDVDVTPDFTGLEVEVASGGGAFTTLTSPGALEVDRVLEPSQVPENTVRVRATGQPLPGSTEVGLQVLSGQLTLTLTGPGGVVTSTSTHTAGWVELPLPLAAAGDYDLDISFVPDISWFYSSAASTVDLVVTRRDQAITARLDVEATARVGQVVRPDFTATSGLPVSYSVPAGTPSTPTACRLTGDGLGIEMLRPEPCLITALQVGNHAWSPASPVLHTVLVSKNPTTTTIQDPADPMVGAPLWVTASTASGGTTPAGDFQLLVDGVAVGPVVTGAGTGVTLPWTPKRAGAATLEVRFTPPAGDVAYLGSTGSTAVTVARAQTQVGLEFTGSTVIARVTAPSEAGAPTGTVRFSAGDLVLGEVALADGAATLLHGIPATQPFAVTAVYSGDADRAAATATGSRGVPTIAATVTPSGPATQGWYSAPVRVSFVCTTTTAPLPAGCPAAVDLTRDGAAQRVVREVVAADGGRASVTTAPISIDRTAPTVRVGGPEDGGWYRGRAPAASCDAVDATSGVASCTLTRTQLSKRNHEIVARAVDNAGNTSTTRIRFQVRTTWVVGARFRRGAFRVRAGSRIKVMALSRGPQPQLVLPKRAGGRPVLPGPPMVAIQIEDGVMTWVARYRLPRAFRKGKVVRLGVKDRSRRMQVVRVRLT